MLKQVLLVFSLAAVFSSQVLAQTVVTETAPAKTSLPPQVDPAEDKYQPVLHARKAGVTTCLPAIDAQSKSLIDGDHIAASSWSTSAPNDKLFYSGIGMHSPNKMAPDIFALIFAMPGGNDCASQSVQIYPVARKCGEVEKTLSGKASKIGDLQRIAFLQNDDLTRTALIPGPANSCTIVTVHRN